MHWLRTIGSTEVPVSRMFFEDGLSPRCGDPVWVLPSGIATTRRPEQRTKITRVLVWLGLRAKPVALYVGVVVDASDYEDHRTCNVIAV